MTDVPIIFSAPMILALLDGSKTQTRRLAWKPWSNESNEHYAAVACPDISRDARGTPSPWQRVKPGDRLWVRESHWRAGRWKREYYEIGKAARWRFVPDHSWDTQVCFEKPNEALTRPHRIHDELAYWNRPSIFLPRELSRLSAVVTATKIERVQQISSEDAIAEGMTQGEHEIINIPQIKFSTLWQTLHGPGSWNENPEVVALTFTVHKTNINAMPKENAA